MKGFLLVLIGILAGLYFIAPSKDTPKTEKIEKPKVQETLGGFDSKRTSNLPVQIRKTNYTKQSDYDNKKNNLISKVRAKTPLTNTEFEEYLDFLNKELAGLNLDYSDTLGSFQDGSKFLEKLAE